MVQCPYCHVLSRWDFDSYVHTCLVNYKQTNKPKNKRNQHSVNSYWLTLKRVKHKLWPFLVFKIFHGALRYVQSCKAKRIGYYVSVAWVCTTVQEPHHSLFPFRRQVEIVCYAFTVKPYLSASITQSSFYSNVPKTVFSTVPGASGAISRGIRPSSLMRSIISRHTYVPACAALLVVAAL